MYAYGKVSQDRLDTCHWVLQMLMERVMARQRMDVAIACGTRTEAEQNKAVSNGFSHVEFPNSKHNGLPSWAVDTIPFPEKWSSDRAFARLEDIIWTIWGEMPAWIRARYTLRSGHDWDMDGVFNEDEQNANQLLNDRPHWELIRK